MTHTPEEIIDKLGQLDTDEIARLFRDEGVTGYIREARACPVSNYVYVTTGERISVTPDGWFTVADFEPLKKLPASVDRFARQFDVFDYPDLIDD